MNMQTAFRQYQLFIMTKYDFDVLQSWFECNYLNVIESETKVLSLGNNSPYLELFADRTCLRPPLDTVNELKLLSLTNDSALSFKEHVKSVCNKVHAKVAALRRVHKFIPVNVMINIYKAFILPRLEYCMCSSSCWTFDGFFLL